MNQETASGMTVFSRYFIIFGENLLVCVTGTYVLVDVDRAAHGSVLDILLF